MEGLLSSLTKDLLVKLSSSIYQEISSVYGVRTNLDKLKITIETIEAVIFDAEIKKIHNKEVNNWVHQLKDVLYDAEDLFDEFDREALRRKLMNRWRIDKKVTCLFPMQFNNSIIFNFQMAHRIGMIRNRLDEIASQKQKFYLVENLQYEDFSHTVRDMTHSFIHESEVANVMGRDNDKESIIRFLIQSNLDKELSIISLVGLGGLGKTTLAKLVFNDQRVNRYFKKKMWICVSMDFDVQRLTREILISARDSEITVGLTLDQLQSRLRKELSGQRFLLILDDVWNDDVNKWRDLRQFLMEGAKGSKILVTTRMNLVANIVGSDKKFELKGLSEKDSWSLFAKYVFSDGQEKKIPESLKRIGEEILRKCKGVPLAIKSLGSLLYSKTHIREWEFIRDSEIWNLEDRMKKDDILPALKLSYSLIPSYLKPCFVYCAFFPKDYVYSDDRLIRLWMAQGMLHSINEKEELEEIGERYLKELCSRSFFQDFEIDTYSHRYKFKMHDLIHDLALSILSDAKSTLGSAKHLYYPNIESINWSHLQPLKRVRSLALSRVSCSICNLFDKCATKFKFLRVLELESALDDSLPDSIGRLKHLKYLNLRYNSSLKSLPNSICELLRLQTLILEDCSDLEKLPSGINNMISLRYLWITETQMCYLLQEARIECLSNLRFLAIMDFSGTFPGQPIMDEKKNQEVGCQSKLQVLHLQSVRWARLPRWVSSYGKTLRQLGLVRCKNLATLPTWISQLSSLETLEIIFCRDLKYLPQEMENLTSLETLEINGSWKLTSLPQGIMNLTSFTKLAINGCGILSDRCHQAITELNDIDFYSSRNYGIVIYFKTVDERDRYFSRLNKFPCLNDIW